MSPEEERHDRLAGIWRREPGSYNSGGSCLRYYDDRRKEMAKNTLNKARGLLPRLLKRFLTIACRHLRASLSVD